jgi:hypothetical protein
MKFAFPGRGLPIPQSRATSLLNLHKPPQVSILRWELGFRLTDISAALNTGQLVKDETFTLFEAVGALEVRQLSDRETCDDNCG